MKRNIIVIVALFTFCLSYAQEKKSAVDAYVEYFNLPRETLFLHTNKTTYLTGEEVWFKVYAYDRKSQLTSKATTNIRLGIFDSEGKQVDEKLFLAKDGFANGSISVDSTFTSGNYFLKASTNWMKNFKEKDAFVKKINIINPKSDEAVADTYKKEYDVQFLPEGGHLLAGVKNIVGVKAINDSGKGSKVSGVIVDQYDSEVASFDSNFLGLGRFSFIPIEGKTYKAKITLSSSKEIEVTLPEMKYKGINIQINNLKSDDVIINLSTNKESFEFVSSQRHTLLIHKDGVTKIIPVVFGSLQESIVIAKQDLFKGINTVTLFDEDQNPLVERMFFNDASFKKNAISLQKKEITGDSIVYSLKAQVEGLANINASISVLPKETKSYNPKHNILSAFYLQPYLKGHIEYPSYYFVDIDRKKRYELDLLLLTQGWSRYDWNDVFNRPPRMNHTFNNGVTLTGNLNDDTDKTKELILFPSELNKSINVKFDEKGRFELVNFLPLKDEYLVFSAITNKEKIKKPGLVVNFPKPLIDENLNVKSYENFNSFYEQNNTSFEGFINNKRKVLDEVVLRAKLDKEKRKKYRLKSTGKLYTVDNALDKRYLDLSHFLDNHSFAINYGAVRSIRHLSPQRNPVVFFLNDVQLTDFNIVSNRPLFEFEDIYIDDTYNSNMVAIQGASSVFATVIKLFTRRTPFVANNARPPGENAIKTSYGFERTKKFYTPKYGAFESSQFIDVGVIDWKPNFVISNNEIKDIKTLNTRTDKVTFYIEGISSNGDLISQEIHVEK